MKELNNVAIKYVAKEVDDLLKETEHSQTAELITRGVALTLKALLTADSAEELPYMVTKQLRTVMRQFKPTKVSDDFELGFMLAIGSVTEAVESTSLNAYTKRMILEALREKLDSLG